VVVGRRHSGWWNPDQQLRVAAARPCGRTRTRTDRPARKRVAPGGSRRARPHAAVALSRAHAVARLSADFRKRCRAR
jgi:hypothetical protein